VGRKTVSVEGKEPGFKDRVIGSGDRVIEVQMPLTFDGPMTR
jgi:hypothetical protein